MSREDRDPADVLTSWALKEYERLQLEAPPLNNKSINVFKQTFKDSEQCYPDVAEDAFIINIYKADKEHKDNKEYKKIEIEEIQLAKNANKKLIELINNNEILENKNPTSINIVSND